MRKFFVFSCAAFAVCLAFADASYFNVCPASGTGYGYTYSYDLSPSDLVSVLFPDVYVMSDGEFYDPAYDAWGGIYPADESDFVSSDEPYYPSDPAYADFRLAPAIDPKLSGGGGGGAGGDSSGLPSFMEGFTSSVSAIALAVGGLLSACAVIYLIFIGWRKYKEACWLAQCCDEWDREHPDCKCIR